MGRSEARDAKTGDLLWDFQVETSKQNKGWVLTADRKFNAPFLSHSSWREAPLVANDQQIRIGGIFSSPLVANGWFTSAAPTAFSTPWNKRTVSLVERQSSGNLLT